MKLALLLIFLATFPCEKEYQRARRIYYKGVKEASFSTIKNSAKKFYVIAKEAPRCRVAPHSLFNAGKAYITLYTMKFDRTLAEKAKNIFLELARRYPNHSLVDDALIKAGNICRFILLNEDCARKYYKEALSKGGDMKEIASRALNTMSGEIEREKIKEMSILKDVNWWISERYVRVTLTFSEKRKYSYTYSEKSEEIKVIVQGAHTDKNIEKEFPSDSFIKRIGVSNKEGSVVIEVKGEDVGGYQVFHFVYPFSILIDVFRSDYHREDAIASIIEEYEKKVSEKKKIPLVILDPGHGGHDPGARGRITVEKNITLRIAKMVRSMLEEKGIKVKMTREDDTFVPLPMRTAIANSLEADLFVSIHINSSRNKRARGIEVYYFDKSIDPDILEVAARENELKEISQEMRKELSFILADLQLTSKTMESAILAEEIETQILKSTSYKRYRYKEVKGGPFYVLMNAKMPAVLVEVCFISNPYEEKLLLKESFIKKVSAGITHGIISYLKRRREI